MRYFYPVTDSDLDVMTFYKLVAEKRIFVKVYRMMCFPQGMSAARFQKLMRMFPTQPIQIATHKKVYPYNRKQHVATWPLLSHVAADDETSLMQLYENIFTSMKDVLGKRVVDFEFDVQLVAYATDDFEMEKPCYLERFPASHNLWEAQRATITAQIDSFLGINIRDLPESLRHIWIDNIRESLQKKQPIPKSIQEMEDRVEVTWELSNKAHLSDMFALLFNELAINTSRSIVADDK
jgi:hypothetical protein